MDPGAKPIVVQPGEGQVVGNEVRMPNIHAPGGFDRRIGLGEKRGADR